MKEWWNKRKEKTRKARRQNDRYTFTDFIIDVLFWIPELLLLPFRMFIWLIMGIAKSIFDLV